MSMSCTQGVAYFRHPHLIFVYVPPSIIKMETIRKKIIFDREDHKYRALVDKQHTDNGNFNYENFMQDLLNSY